MFVAFFRPEASNFKLYLGCVLIMSLVLLRALLGERSRSLGQWYRRYFWLTTATAVAWSGTVVAELLSANQELTPVFGGVLVLSGLTAASGYTLIPSNRLFFVFNFTILLPMCGVLFLIGDQFHISRGILALYPVYFIFLMFTAASARRDLSRLIQNERQLQVLLEVIPAGISLIRRGTYVLANKNVSRRFAGQVRSIIGRKVGELSPNSPLIKHLQEFQASDLRQVSFEEVLPTSEGPRNHFVILKKMANTHDQVLAVSFDTEEQKQAQRILLSQRVQIEANAKLALLGEMSGGVAHEINNPLMVIVSKAELLIRQAKKADVTPSEAVLNTLEIVSKMSARIARIVSGLKTFSREASNDPLVEVAVTDIVNDTLALCEMKLKNRSIDLRLQIEPGLKIPCRPSQISQVLLNLIGNGIDAIQNLETKWIQIVAEQVQDKVLLKVIDSGSGIPLAVRDKIMNPFFTTKEVGQGTGLGLSISFGIVESHHGRMYFDHQQPNTTAVLELPAAAAVRAAS